MAVSLENTCFVEKDFSAVMEGLLRSQMKVQAGG
jgi:hypothetical protein